VNELSVPLETLVPCFQGVIPSWIATCSAEGVPNVTVLSIVHHVDAERVALTRQFFNKTSANLDANPFAQAVLVDPATADQFLLDLRFLHTETEGATFEAMAANLDAVASQTGMEGLFRLRGVDVHRVLRCAPLGETLRETPERRSEQRTIAALDEFVRRLALCADYGQATRTALEALDDLFGFSHSILLVADEHARRLFAVASNGYPVSSAGAEVPIGVGVIGVAAQRRRVVCVPSVGRSRAMRAGIEESIQRSGAELPANEIPLPGLDRVESAAAVPLAVHGGLVGLLYLEAERQGQFGPGDERLLRVLGGQLARRRAGSTPLRWWAFRSPARRRRHDHRNRHRDHRSRHRAVPPCGRRGPRQRLVEDGPPDRQGRRRRDGRQLRPGRDRRPARHRNSAARAPRRRRVVLRARGRDHRRRRQPADRPRRRRLRLRPPRHPPRLLVRSERARMLATISPAGVEELFVACGVPVTGTQPPADEVLPPPDEIIRLFAGYGCDIVGPPPALSDL
jgi:GAF domain